MTISFVFSIFNHKYEIIYVKKIHPRRKEQYEFSSLHEMNQLRLKRKKRKRKKKKKSFASLFSNKSVF